jgi:hypothetical protein
MTDRVVRPVEVQPLRDDPRQPVTPEPSVEERLNVVVDAVEVALDPASTARAKQDALARLRALRTRGAAP